MKPPSSEVSPCDDPRSLLENCASPRCGSHDRARLSTVTSVFAAGWPLVRNRLSTITSCSPSRCLRSRSSFDVRARIHARVRTVVRSCERPSALLLACSRPFAPCGAPGRAHLLVFVSAFVFRRSRPFPLRRLTVHGLASSCHVTTAFTAILFREPPLHTAHVHRVRAHLATITFACPYHRAFA